MLKSSTHILLPLLVLFLACTLSAQATENSQSPRMTKKELLPLLESSDVVIIDIRTKHQWERSEKKIPGAVHEPPFEAAQWGDKYDRDKTVVTYCS
ncbi:MAG: rhodanese-like domain-containing protein [Desulfovermiculus sp.]